jgi:hypothetical protein
MPSVVFQCVTGQAVPAETFFASHSRISRWVCSACSGLATLPVPMAQTGSEVEKHYVNDVRPDEFHFRFIFIFVRCAFRILLLTYRRQLQFSSSRPLLSTVRWRSAVPRIRPWWCHSRVLRASLRCMPSQKDCGIVHIVTQWITRRISS